MNIMTIEEIAKRDSICNSLAFLVEECTDGDNPFFLITALMLLQVQAHLKLAEEDYSQQLLNAMREVGKRRFKR